MATYATLVGIVQQFGDEPAMRERDVKGQTVREFTVKSTKTNEQGQQTLVRVSLWPEWGDITVSAGDAVIAEGALTTNDSGGKTYHNLNPKTFAHIPALTRSERQVVNQQASADDTSF